MSNATANRLGDAAARLEALAPDRSFIVQAPAGSGKTELLTQRYLQLLAMVDQPEQILAITFTRKAASEMRNRVLQALQRAASPRPEQAHAAQTWDLARAARAADVRHGWQLENYPSRLRIQTIDALNAALSRRLPLLAGTGAAMDIAQDLRPIYEAVCERLLRRLGDGSAESVLLETVLMHLANRVPDFVNMMCELLARRDQWLPLLMQHVDDAELCDSIEFTLRAVIEHHLQVVMDALPARYQTELLELAVFAARNRIAAGDADPVLMQLATRFELPPITADALLEWRALGAMLCKKDGGRLKPEFYLKVDKRHGFPADKDKQAVKARMQTLLVDLAAVPGLAELFAVIDALPAPQFSEQQRHVLTALLQLLPIAVSELMLEFQARGQVDYVELSLRALRALGTSEQPTDTALALDARLQHILVDEFQDTSYIQMSLLNLLTAGWSAGDGRTLFCVGDPMQSIYRFRQAEVGLFIGLQQHGLPHLKLDALRLRTNFRSTQPVVEWVNRSFPTVLPSRDDSESGAVKFSASDTRADALHAGYVQVHAGIERSPQLEAQAIAQLVMTTLAQSTQDKIAILVGGRGHVGPISAELKRAGIKFAAVDIERLQDRPLVQDLISLTRALLHLGDRTAWLACLRAPWCGLTLADLHAVAADDARQSIWSLLNDAEVLQGLTPEGLARVQRFNAAVSRALQERARHALRDWVERCWLALAGPATLQSASELADAEAFFARLTQLEVAGDLEDSARLESQLSELFAAPRVQQGARVEIMTIHKSKGLEFDVVILPSLHRSTRGDDKKLLRWTRVAGLDADGLVVAPPSAKGEDSDSIYQWLNELEKQRTRYERGRLLYVAATRAKHQLHLFGSTDLEADGIRPRKSRDGSLLALLWPHVVDDFVAAAQQHSTKMIESTPVQPLLLRRLPLSWSPPPPPKAVAALPSQTAINAQLELPEFDWVSETGRHVGTAVHAELERLVKLPAAHISQWNAAQRRPTLMLQLAELGVPEALRTAAVERVIKAIESTLTDERGRWILGLDVVHGQAAAELALTGVIDGATINIVIDRSFIDAHGTRWIIDFKTSVHEGGGRDEFLRSEEQRYRGQLERYATLMRAYQPERPIKTALYFPLMAQWREL